ncbi:TetR/AcrR family transcriptional regulator [Frankia sp. CNm7]|nr:TetR/AcrR family transcriptional regulator [Frankia nepalensis]MBL7521536.1 TetR/AcrR family transcriptional regulator [Frankia nepalensis]
MIEATIACILDRGFYRATSNEIARRAGFTWGAIQRQFGSREALLLAVYEQEWAHLLATMREARIEGDTTEERIRSLFYILKRHYGRPEAFAVLQITMNLRKDPKTSPATLDIIRKSTREAEKLMPPLVREVLGADADLALRYLVFYTIRDFWIGLHVESATALEETVRGRYAMLMEDENLLVEALAAVAESRAAKAQVRSGPASSTKRRRDAQPR